MLKITRKYLNNRIKKVKDPASKTWTLFSTKKRLGWRPSHPRITLAGIWPQSSTLGKLCEPAVPHLQICVFWSLHFIVDEGKWSRGALPLSAHFFFFPEIQLLALSENRLFQGIGCVCWWGKWWAELGCIYSEFTNTPAIIIWPSNHIKCQGTKSQKSHQVRNSDQI